MPRRAMGNRKSCRRKRNTQATQSGRINKATWYFGGKLALTLFTGSSILVLELLFVLRTVGTREDSFRGADQWQEGEERG